MTEESRLVEDERIIEALAQTVEQTVTGPVGFAVPQDQSAARAEVLRLKESLEENYFHLGAVLNQIVHEKWYSAFWGYSTFKEYVQQEVGFGYRKAMYLANIYATLVAAGITWEAVRSIGWGKMREMVGVLTRENVHDWIDKAHRMTALQLAEEAKRARLTVEHEGSVSVVTVKNFRLRDAQIQNVDQALSMAKEIGHVETPGEALDLICSDFLINHVDGSRGDLEFILGRIADLFNVEITATQRGNRAEAAAQSAMEAGEPTLESTLAFGAQQPPGGEITERVTATFADGSQATFDPEQDHD